jgi:Ser/Thr protein kinase RdoA (MazF antagonist)
LHCYGLGLIKAQNLPLGQRSHNVIVNTTAGRKVLKRYRPKWQPPTINYGHSILDRLAECNFPAPRLVATPGGATSVTHNSRYYALFNYVKGSNYAASYLPRSHWFRLATLAGQTLARLHQQLEGFMPQGRHHLGFISYDQGRNREVAWYVAQVPDLIAKSQKLTPPEAKVHADWLLQKGDWLAGELQSLDEVLRAAALPRLIIHGDYALQNLLFQPDGSVTPVDFELARLEWRLSDLVTSLLRFGNARERYDMQTMRAFMTAYQAEYPISAEEWPYFPDVWQFRRLKRALLFWQSYFQPGATTQRLISAREALAQAQWAAAHREQLLDINR